MKRRELIKGLTTLIKSTFLPAGQGDQHSGSSSI